MVSSDYLPDPAQRLSAQYTRVGATQQHLDIQGATSIVETLPGGTNAYDVASQLTHQGYRGCRVIAVGLNDAADVYVGSSVGLTTRINKMMSVIGNQPVLWVNVKSLVAGGPDSEDNTGLWNSALTQACSSYPNMHLRLGVGGTRCLFHRRWHPLQLARLRSPRSADRQRAGASFPSLRWSPSSRLQRRCPPQPSASST
jgi:hypothetical protein